MADPMTPEDEQRVRELLEMHPALLQPEAIELRRHLLDAREDVTAARAEVERLRAELDDAAHTRRRVERERDQMAQRVEQGRRAAVVYVERIQEVEAERDRLAEEIRKAAAYLFRRADLDADLSPSESRALATELRDVTALDGTEATP